MNTQIADLGKLLRHIKQLAQTHPNKAQLASALDIRYHRIQTFCGRDDAMLWPEELQKLAEYFGMKIYADIVTVDTNWIPHPANAAYEYEVDGLRRPTGKVRAIVIAQAAE